MTEFIEEDSLTNQEGSVESKSVLRRQIIQKDGKFKYGKYFGRTFKEVLAVDPDYIIQAYETAQDNAGISRECYRMAQLQLDEEHDYEDREWEALNVFKMEDDWQDE